MTDRLTHPPTLLVCEYPSDPPSLFSVASYSLSPETSAVQCSDRAVVINSFSKYYSMTGTDTHTSSGHIHTHPLDVPLVAHRVAVGLACGAVVPGGRHESTLAEPVHQRTHLEPVRGLPRLPRGCDGGAGGKYKANRDIVLATLRELQIDQNASPADGAFYVYVDLAEAGVRDSTSLCRLLLEEAGVAVTPGCDFEDPTTALGHQRVRFSYSRSTEEVRKGMQRFKTWWLANPMK